jgi:hypothetical protein
MIIKKKKNQKEKIGIIGSFLLNKDKEYNVAMQNKITIELDNEIFRQAIGTDEKNYQIEQYIPELKQGRIRQKYMEYVVDFSGQTHGLKKNNFNKIS